MDSLDKPDSKGDTENKEKDAKDKDECEKGKGCVYPVDIKSMEKDQTSDSDKRAYRDGKSENNFESHNGCGDGDRDLEKKAMNFTRL